MKNSRIGVRLEPELREKAEKLVKSGKFKSFSQIIRKALRQFLGTPDKPFEEYTENIVFEHIKNCPHCRKKVWKIFANCVVSNALKKIPLNTPQEIREMIREKLEEEIEEKLQEQVV